MKDDVQIRFLFTSGGHSFIGRHGKEPAPHEMTEQTSIECVAGKGILGDRFFDFKPNYKGQLTFFSLEVYQDLQRQFAVKSKPPSVFRRNVIVSGLDLNALIGRRFWLGGIAFEGVEQASPCYWMNRAFCEGAEAALRGRGGLRARILSDGTLSLGRHAFSIQAEERDD